MNKFVVVIFIIVITIAISVMIRKTVLNKLLKQLYDAAFVSTDKEAFNLLINSLPAQMTMSEISRDIVRLNAAVSWNDKEEVKRVARKASSLRMKNEEAQTVYGVTVGYLCEKRDPEALFFLEKMKEYFKDTNNVSSLVMVYDSQLIYDIYIEKKADRKAELVELADTVEDGNAKAVYQYRLAVLDYYLGNKEESVKELRKALDNTSSAQAKKKIERILKGEWNLL
ncbi:MAG: hypothetical protein IKD84_05180 [Erysipelotrichaceae bacterium]|nr:hypothetical protein [Erysipelotrichaceae bacterium]